MNEQLGGGRKKRRMETVARNLSALGAAVEGAGINLPPRPQSLSSAAPDKSPEVDTSQNNVNTATQSFFDAVGEGRDLDAVFYNQLEWLTPDEQKRFRKQLKKESADRGLKLDLPDEAGGDALGEDALQKPDPEETPHAPSEEEISEFDALKKARPEGDGKQGGQTFWRTDDGGAFLERSGGAIRFVHGGPLSFRDTKKQTKISYWDKESGRFTNVDPTPEVREAIKKLRSEERAKRSASKTRPEKQGETTSKKVDSEEPAPARLKKINPDQLEEAYLSQQTPTHDIDEFPDRTNKGKPSEKTKGGLKDTPAPGILSRQKDSKDDGEEDPEAGKDKGPSIRSEEDRQELLRKLDARHAREREAPPFEEDGDGLERPSLATDDTGKMRDIYRMQEAREALRRRKGALHPISGEALDTESHERTMRDILSKKSEQDLFLNGYLAQRNPRAAKEIVQRLADGETLTHKQQELLEQARGSYNLLRAEVDSVREVLTSAEMARIARTDPRLTRILGQIGAEEMESLMDHQFFTMAIRDEKNFRTSVEAFKAVNALRTSERAEMVTKRLHIALGEHRISEEEFIKATMGGVSVESKHNLDAAVRSQYGLFTKVVDSVLGRALSHRGGRRLYGLLQEQQSLDEEVNKQLHVIAVMLRGTLNKDIESAIQRYMVEGGSVLDKQQKFDVTTLGEYRKVKADMSKRALNERWRSYKDAELKRRKIDKKNPASPELIAELKDSFSSEEVGRRKRMRAKGLLAALLSFFIVGREEIKRELE